MDLVTRYISRSIDFVFLDNPHGTAMGALGGATLLFLAQVFAPSLSQQQIVDFTHTHPLLFIAVGAFVANVTRFARMHRLPEPIEARLHFIRDEVRAKRITRRQARELYAELIQAAIVAVVKREDHGNRSRTA